MSSFAMDIQKEGLQFGAKTHVIVRAAEPTLLAKLEERNAADRASPLVEPSQLFGRLADRQMLCQQASHRGQSFVGFLHSGRQEFVRAVFAQVQFVRFAVYQIRDVECSRLVTLLTFHRMPRTPREPHTAGPPLFSITDKCNVQYTAAIFSVNH
jgi:hypothetical protein